MSNSPRVSIVTPSYNQANFLENTILSILEQDYPNLEYIIIDGGSTDGSIEIIKKYARYLTYWHSQPDNGQVEAINIGFQKATGQLLSVLNSDDFLLQGAVSHMVELHQQHPHAVGWVGGAYGIAQDGFIIHIRQPQNITHEGLANWEENWFYQPACFFSAQVTRLVGLFNPNYENAFDFDFWMRVTNFGDLIPTSKVVIAATIHPEAKTQKFRARMYDEVKKIQLAYGYEELAKISQRYSEQARSQTATSTLAKLIYTTHSQKRSAPNRFVRLPQKPEGI